MQPLKEAMRPLLGGRCLKRRNLWAARWRLVVAARCPTPRRPLTRAAPMTAGPPGYPYELVPDSTGWRGTMPSHCSREHYCTVGLTTPHRGSTGQGGSSPHPWRRSGDHDIRGHVIMFGCGCGVLWLTSSHSPSTLIACLRW